MDSTMYCCRSPSDVDLAALPKGGAHDDGEQHVPNPRHVERFGQSHVCCVPRIMVAWRGAMRYAGGRVAFKPMRKPVLCPRIGKPAAAAEATSKESEHDIAVVPAPSLQATISAHSIIIFNFSLSCLFYQLILV